MQEGQKERFRGKERERRDGEKEADWLLSAVSTLPAAHRDAH